MIIDTLSVFPQMFDGPMGMSMIGRARKAGILRFNAYDLRDWTHDRHRTTDDEPYGGGAGQLMKVEPVYEALDDLMGLTSKGDGVGNADMGHACDDGETGDARPVRPQVIFFAPHGKRFDQQMAVELSRQEHLIMVCGHYEGFDERVYERADHIISIGDYVVTGGELAAMVVTDAVCRLIPGVLGNEQSSVDESFSAESDNLLEYPQYTRPAEYRGMKVPDVLLSGDHAAVDKWRHEQALKRTAELRPDLLR
ncbi:MAG: tRNA (guanosine(37)-N1)-methyltransferase TrmD [Coriobacteriales bacterium]|nr:tRNA (guanosine(37)-N1)-methyltransferase TrmD [Coriobacteriales bacterium]